MAKDKNEYDNQKLIKMSKLLRGAIALRLPRVTKERYMRKCTELAVG